MANLNAAGIVRESCSGWLLELALAPVLPGPRTSCSAQKRVDGAGDAGETAAAAVVIVRNEETARRSTGHHARRSAATDASS